jgi:hypothetical protein
MATINNLLLLVIIAIAGVTLQRWFGFRRRRDTSKGQQNVTMFDYHAVPITPLFDFDITRTKPAPYTPWSTGKFSMSMGIQKTTQEEWLALDDRYLGEQALRRELLEDHREGVMQALPGTEGACLETLEFAVSFLTRRYPRLFFHPDGKTDYIHNSLTKRTFRVCEPLDTPALEVAAQLLMEDLNVLIQGFGDDPDQHYLSVLSSKSCLQMVKE